MCEVLANNTSRSCDFNPFTANNFTLTFDTFYFASKNLIEEKVKVTKNAGFGKFVSRKNSRI